VSSGNGKVVKDKVGNEDVSEKTALQKLQYQHFDWTAFDERVCTVRDEYIT